MTTQSQDAFTPHTGVQWYVLDKKTRDIVDVVTAPDRVAAFRKAATRQPLSGKDITIQSVISYTVARGDKKLPPFDSRRAMTTMGRTGGRVKAHTEQTPLP